MAESDNRFFEEMPLRLDSHDAAMLKGAADEVLTFLQQKATTHSHGVTVIGILGERGSGKTSLLNVVAQRARKDLRARMAYAEEPSPDDRKVALLGLEELGQGDDLLAHVLTNLAQIQDSAEGGHDPTTAQRATSLWDLYVARQERQIFLKFTESAASSQADLKRRVGEFVRDQHLTTRSLRTEIGKLVKALADDGKEGAAPVLILIDDLDLHPHRAAEVFDLLGSVLGHPNLAILIALDPGALVRGLTWRLQKEYRGDRDLAWAFYDKWIPYRVNVPAWDPEERLEFLWPKKAEVLAGGVKPILPQLWQSVSLKVLTDVLAHYDEVPEASTPLVASHWEAAHELLAGLLPHTPRGLKRFHNTLAQSRVLEDGLPSWVKAWANRESIGEELLPVLYTLALAFDSHHQEVRLIEFLWHYPGKVKTTRRPTPTRIRKAHRDSGHEADTFVGFDLDSEPLPTEPEPGITLTDYRQFCFSIIQLSTAQKRSLAPRFLAISVMANAWGSYSVRAEVQGGATLRGKEVWHLDLLGGAYYRPSATELRTLPDRAKEALSQMEKYRGEGLIVGAKAPLSLLTWIGWRLRRLPVKVFYNDFGGAITDILPPPEIYRPADTPLVRLGWVGETREVAPHTEAIVMIDLLQKGGAAQVTGWPETTRESSIFTPLVLSDQQGPLPAEVAYDCIRDVINHMGRLRTQGVDTFHIGMAAPDFFAFYLGRNLHALGRIHLYEYDPNLLRYEYVVTLYDSDIGPGPAEGEGGFEEVGSEDGEITYKREEPGW